MTFCTLFDSNYLDKGLALYHSLCQVSGDFRLYIFCFDSQSFDVLTAMALDHARIFHHSCIEDETLLRLKKERTKAEYCWTCTPIIIEYVLNSCKEDACTYLDADLYFFSNPKELIREIEEDGADVAIMEHRFPESTRGRRLCRRSGKYCVEFNYFKNSDNSKKVLNWWKEKCAEWCFHIYEPDRMGDQKYLEKFPVLFDGIHVIQNQGGGVAPWNIARYRLYESTKRGLFLLDKSNENHFPLVFYHFQNLRYLSDNLINVNSETHDKKLKDAIYKPYLRALEMERNELKKYGIVINSKRKLSSNKFIGFLQGTLLRFKIKSFSDIYDLRQFR